MHFLSCAPLLQQHWRYTGTSSRDIRVWQSLAESIPSEQEEFEDLSLGGSSAVSNTQCRVWIFVLGFSFMVGGKSFTVFTFFHYIFNFSYPTWTKILKPFKTAKDFTSSFLLSSKTGGQGTEAKGRRKRG